MSSEHFLLKDHGTVEVKAYIGKCPNCGTERVIDQLSKFNSDSFGGITCANQDDCEEFELKERLLSMNELEVKNPMEGEKND